MEPQPTHSSPAKGATVLDLQKTALCAETCAHFGQEDHRCVQLNWHDSLGRAYLRCQSSGFIFNPRTNANEAAQPAAADYLKTVNVPGFEYMAHDLLANFHCLAKTRVAATLAGAPRKLRVLEIGSALGFFLSILRDEGWEVEGREMWADWRRFSNRYLNVPTSGELMQGQGKPKYDLIFCSQVLEHVANFAEFLAAAYSRLLRGGMLAVSTTNSNIGTLPRASLDGKMVNVTFSSDTPRTKYFVFDNHLHINHWSQRSIGAAARNVGFKNIYTKTRGEDNWELVMYAIKAE
eukprot:CAMPEP_0119320632 /NCGR_PEP_ID=MMETSP1333-20130426/52979_1 /TAXON_ID=418940 /ORGANISM="Scyphosphaera apsteinii, Strain RCC1455" /LENGTH=291 /DNA_ID=CAMNT_0007327393 /DNA_START=98 /DNA_END=973 /DNA_ORIENTATION=-